jgi:hypothetical protein
MAEEGGANTDSALAAAGPRAVSEDGLKGFPVALSIFYFLYSFSFFFFCF